ncbi:MAG: hypothetical protein IKU36_07390 [Bacteroidales bacterium]|nr:hypothetical protein [Bacteroidales bacterium]
MKRILTIIFAALALAACDPADKKAENQFNAEDIVNTKWEGTLKNIEGSTVKSTADVTLRFDSATIGRFTQKRSGATSKESYDLSYSISDMKITFDCPVISGTWEVSNYTEQSMVLTLLPAKNSIMTLSIN